MPGCHCWETPLTSQILAGVIGSAGTAIVAAGVLWYLYQPHVKAAFGRTS